MYTEFDMKVCLVAANSLRVSPYIKKYADMLDDNNIEYDIITKEHIREKNNIADASNIYFFRDAKNAVSKLLRHLKYANFVKKTLKKREYDKVVFFTGTNAAFSYFVFSGYMRKNFDYIIDIRDYDKNFDNIFLSYYLNKAVKYADTVIISSERFKSWLPKTNTVYVMHNLPNNSVKKEHTEVFAKESVKIGYLGGIGYFEQNKSLADALRDSEKIRLIYRGIYPKEYNIKNYCEETNVKNAEFFGKYDDSEKAHLYSDIDIINAVYGNDSLTVTTALPNKLYDSLYYKIPIMVSAGTYLAQIVEKYNLGFSVDTSDAHINEKICDYIKNFDPHKFDQGCNQYLEYAEREQKETEAKLHSFFEV